MQEFLLNNSEINHMIFIGSLVLMAFCSGAIVGATLLTRRHEKIYNYLFDEVLTQEQIDDVRFYH
jgi:hypothetical protein|tara:strand:+ start:115 stop:309 length:195 start_codon:yes stop_codon:yes gene_type:complete